MAADLGRFKGVVCLDRRSTREAAFRTIDTDGGALAELFAEHPDALLVIEACANAGWFHDLAVEPYAGRRVSEWQVE